MENIQLTDIFFVDREYSNRHPHMLHRHADVLELLYIFSESGRYIVGNYEYAVTEGDFVICGANIPHGEDPFQNHHIQTYCLVLSGASFAPAENERPIISLGKGNSIGGLLPELYNMFHKQTGYSEVCRHLALGIYFLLQRKFLERVANPKQLKRERLVFKILDYLNEHYAENLSLDKISEHFFISKSNLSHYFKRETGLSPIQYIMQRRIGEAQSLLVETSLPIQEIEFQLGFNDSAHFSKMFKKYVGVTPNEYRKHFAGRRRR